MENVVKVGPRTYQDGLRGETVFDKLLVISYGIGNYQIETACGSIEELEADSAQRMMDDENITDIVVTTISSRFERK